MSRKEIPIITLEQILNRTNRCRALVSLLIDSRAVGNRRPAVDTLGALDELLKRNCECLEGTINAAESYGQSDERRR